MIEYELTVNNRKQWLLTLTECSGVDNNLQDVVENIDKVIFLSVMEQTLAT